MWGQPAQASVSQGFGQQQSAWGAQPGAGTQTYPSAQAYQAPQSQQQRNADPYAYGQQPSSAAHGSVPGFKDPYASAGGYGTPQQVGAGSTIQYDQYGQVTKTSELTTTRLERASNKKKRANHDATRTRE